MSEAIAKQSYRWHRMLQSPYLCRGAGIYAIINSSNHKIYIGSAIRLNHRWNEHKNNLADKKHHSRYFQRAFDKDPGSFSIAVIEELDNPTKEQLLSREQFWMDFYKSYLPENGYNISPSASSCQGIKRSPESIAAMSARQKGKRISESTKAKLRIANKGQKGRVYTEQQREDCRIRRTGTTLTEATKKKLSDIGKLNPNKAERVFQYTLDGKFIAEYKTIIEAEKVFGKRSNIHSVCKGKRRLAFGFAWRYAKDNPSRDGIIVAPRRPHGPHKKKVR